MAKQEGKLAEVELATLLPPVKKVLKRLKAWCPTCKAALVPRATHSLPCVDCAEVRESTVMVGYKRCSSERCLACGGSIFLQCLAQEATLQEKDVAHRWLSDDVAELADHDLTGAAGTRQAADTGVSLKEAKAVMRHFAQGL